MANKKGRDWSEWQKQIEGEEHLPKKWNAPRLESRINQHDETTASIVLPRQFSRDYAEEKKMLKWILIFMCGLLLRKCYFEITKYERVRNEATTVSREK